MPSKKIKYNVGDVFLYYHADGKVHAMSPEADESQPFVVLGFDAQQKFSSSGLTVGNCMIVFADDGTYEITNIEVPTTPTIHNFIHKIQPIVDGKEECIIQRTPSAWNFRLAAHVKGRILKDQNKKINFYLCQKDDIHYLIRTIRFDLYDLVDNEYVEIPFLNDQEGNLDKFSLVTSQYFKTYGVL